jgi:hypothetical protein
MRQAKTWGGARTGAGRKAIPFDTIAVRWVVKPETKEWLKAQAKQQGVSIAVILDELIKTFEEVAHREA